MSSEVEITETPNWLRQLEANREQRLKARLGHETGAGAPCLKCGDKCPGLDLHFWRKCCKICKCSKEEHEVQDDDIYGWAQFQLLGNRPNKIKSKIVLPGKKDELELDWVPKGHKDTVEKYLRTLPADSLPVKGSRAARDRKQLLHKQIPVHDVDPALCHELNEDELRLMNEYVAYVKENSVGVGQIVNLSSIIKGSLHVLNPSEAALIASRYPKGVPLSEIVKLQAQARSEGLGRKLERATLNEKNLPGLQPKELAQLRDVQNPISPSKVHDKVYPIGNTDEDPSIQTPMYSGQLRNQRADPHNPNYPSKLIKELPNQAWTQSRSIASESLDPNDPKYSQKLLREPMNRPLNDYDRRLGPSPMNNEILNPNHPSYTPKLLRESLDQTWSDYDPNLGPSPTNNETLNPNHPSYTPKLLRESLDQSWPDYDPNFGPRLLTSESLGPSESLDPEYTQKLPMDRSRMDYDRRLGPNSMNNEILNPNHPSYTPKLLRESLDQTWPDYDPNLGPRPITSESLRPNRDPRDSNLQSSTFRPLDPNRQNIDQAYRFNSPYAPGDQQKSFLDQKQRPLIPFDPNSDPEQDPRARSSAFVPYSKAKPGDGPQVAETVEGARQGRNLPSYAPGKYDVLTDRRTPTNLPVRNMKDLVYSTYDPNRVDTNRPNDDAIPENAAFRAGSTASKQLSQLRPRDHSVSEDFVQPSQVTVGAIQDINYPEIKAAVQGTNDFYEDYSPESIREILNNVKLPDCHYCKKPFEENEFAVTIERANALFHAECFRCAGCNQILADNVYFYSKETDNIYCGRDYAKIRGFPRCKACDELIFTKEYCLAENSTFHLKHFCCIECDTTLAGRDYTLEEGMPYCLPCFEHSKASKCNSCQRIIKPDEVGCTLNGVHFHADEGCFACKICKTPLIGKKLLLRNLRLYCSHECFGKDA